MQRTRRGRCFYARLRSYSVWRNSHSVLVAQRHTANQKKTIMVLGFLACCNCLRDCSPRYNSLCRAPDLLHCISSAVARRCLHLFERRHFCFERLHATLSAAKLGARVGDPNEKLVSESASMIFSSNRARTPRQEERCRALQHIHLADPQSSRRLW